MVGSFEVVDDGATEAPLHSSDCVVKESLFVKATGSVEDVDMDESTGAFPHGGKGEDCGRISFRF